MRIGIFNNVRGGVQRFQPYAAGYTPQLDFIPLAYAPTLDNIQNLRKEHCDALLYFNDHKEQPDFFKTLADNGVKYLVTCSAGYDQFDLQAMKRYQLKGANVPAYSPNAIAEYTVMIVLTLLRKLRVQCHRILQHNFGIQGLKGRELRNMTVGIVGTGRIGRTTIECLSGFHPKEILAYSPHHHSATKATYMSLEELYKQADVIIFHCAATEDNYHMVNWDTLRLMKDGVVLVNAARGSLFDTKAVFESVVSGKIGALGLDVIEGEELLRKRYDMHCEAALWLTQLLQYENVIYTPHTAFYTDEAERNMSETTVSNLYEYATTGTCRNELVR